MSLNRFSYLQKIVTNNEMPFFSPILKINLDFDLKMADFNKIFIMKFVNLCFSGALRH